MSSAYITDPSPYNVYTSSIDINNGHTCSLFTSTKVDLGTTIVLMSAGMAIFGGNIFAWGSFMHKFGKIIQFTATEKSSRNNTNDGFYRVMKEQTLIVALAVSSTVLFYMIQMTGFLGQFFVTLDFALTPMFIFLGFQCNRYYFELLKCDKLAVLCCNKFEERFGKRSDEKIAVDIIRQNSPGTSANNTTTDTLSVSTKTTPMSIPMDALAIPANTTIISPNTTASTIQVQYAGSQITPLPVTPTPMMNTHDSDISTNLEHHASSGMNEPSVINNPSTNDDDFEISIEMSTRL